MIKDCCCTTPYTVWWNSPKFGRPKPYRCTGPSEGRQSDQFLRRQRMWGLVGDGRAPLGQRTHQLQTPFLCHLIAQFLQHSQEVKIKTEYNISRRKQLEIQKETALGIGLKMCPCYHNKDDTHAHPLHTITLCYYISWISTTFFHLYNISIIHHCFLPPGPFDSVTTMPVIFILKCHLNPPPHSTI